MPELDLPPEGTLEWAEEIYMNGGADQVSGDVESPTGHFYLVDRYITITDDRGFNSFHEFATVEDAEVAFDNLNEEYCEWAGDDDN